MKLLGNCRFIMVSTTALVCSYGTSLEAKLPRRDQALTQQHALPAGNLKTKLDKAFSGSKDIVAALTSLQAHFIKKNHQIVAMLPEEPNFIIKALPSDKSYKMNIFSDRLNASRVIVADEIRSLIADQKLNNIVVPQKWLYHLPGKPETLNDRNYIVIVEKLDLLDGDANLQALKNLTAVQIKEIYAVIRGVGLYDARSNNIIITKRGKVAFIDTEPRWAYNVPFFKRALKKFLGERGAQKFNHETGRSFPEGVWDVFDVHHAPVQEHRCDIETQYLICKAMMEHEHFRGLDDLTLLGEGNNGSNGEIGVPTRLDLDESNQIIFSDYKIDLATTASIVAL